MFLKIKVDNLLFFLSLLLMIIFTQFSNLAIGIIFLFFLSLYIINSMRSRKGFLLSIFFLLFFQMVSKNYTTGLIYNIFGYFDEFLTLSFGFYILYKILDKKIRLEKFEIRIFIFFIIFCFISLISNIIYKSQGLFPIFVDFITCSKFLVMYYFTRVYIKCNNISYDDFLADLLSKCKIISVVLFLLSILNIIIPSLYEKFDYRFIMYSLQLFFPHPTYLAAVTILLIIVFLASNQKKNILYIILTILVTISTFRVKALVSIFAILLFYVGYYKMKIHFKTFWILIILIFGCYMAYDQIQLYYNNNRVETIRSTMTNDSISLANERFPLGTGFATFGSTAAYQFNSSLYYKLGYFHGSYKTAAMADVFWPIVIAQSGWIGMTFFAFMVAQFIVFILRKSKDMPLLFVCSLSIFIYELINSIAETAFFNPVVSCYFILLGVIITGLIDYSYKTF